MASRQHARSHSASTSNVSSRNDIRRQLFKSSHTHAQSSGASNHPHVNSLSSHVPIRARTYHRGTSTSNTNTNNANPFDDNDDFDYSADIVIDEKDGGMDVALMALMMEKMIKPQENEAKYDQDSLLAETINLTSSNSRTKSPLVMKALQDSLKAQVVSLQSDNWMYESEEEYLS